VTAHRDHRIEAARKLVRDLGDHGTADPWVLLGRAQAVTENLVDELDDDDVPAIGARDMLRYREDMLRYRGLAAQMMATAAVAVNAWPTIVDDFHLGRMARTFAATFTALADGDLDRARRLVDLLDDQHLDGFCDGMVASHKDPWDLAHLDESHQPGTGDVTTGKGQ
jgi:hypothetical protein